VVDGRFYFRLYRDGELAWEKPAPSMGVMIPAQAELIVMIGKKYGEGVPTDGPNVRRGITVLNTQGEVITRADVGTIVGAHLLPDGRMLVQSTGGISLLDLPRDAGTIWQLPLQPTDLRAFEDVSFFATREWQRDRDQDRETLYETETGRKLVSIVRPHADRPQFFAAGADGQYAMLRLTTAYNPVVCDVWIYRTGQWDKPELVLTGIEGPAFAGDRSPDGTIALAVNRGWRPHVEIRDAGGLLLLEHRCKSKEINWHRAYIRFNAEGDRLFCRHDVDELIFAREGSD
jgi:hypothetical protein